VHVRVSTAVTIDGDLTLPEHAVGVVIFAHGSGSSRFSPRNRMVASALNERGIGTLLLDLLTPEEERVDDVTRKLRFDVEMLAARLVAARSHVGDSTGLPVGYFGASTGAAAALLAAADEPAHVRAIVSRGGRPDLAAELTIVPGATHLFEEPGALDEVARIAADWFCAHLPVHD
jgi:putative phosphoribosyl transferase